MTADETVAWIAEIDLHAGRRQLAAIGFDPQLRTAFSRLQACLRRDAGAVGIDIGQCAAPFERAVGPRRAQQRIEIRLHPTWRSAERRVWTEWDSTWTSWLPPDHLKTINNQ